jgi:hypothetical protein
MARRVFWAKSKMNSTAEAELGTFLFVPVATPFFNPLVHELVELFVVAK